VTFYFSKDQRRLRGLENLALERIARVIEDIDNHDRLQWSVTGTITEFRGSILLLDTACHSAESLNKRRRRSPLSDLVLEDAATVDLSPFVMVSARKKGV